MALIAFAKKIGLKANWIQYGSLTHFDLTPGKRAQALRAGAREITFKGVAARLRAKRDQMAEHRHKV